MCRTDLDVIVARARERARRARAGSMLRRRSGRHALSGSWRCPGRLGCARAARRDNDRAAERPVPGGGRAARGADPARGDAALVRIHPLQHPHDPRRGLVVAGQRHARRPPHPPPRLRDRRDDGRRLRGVRDPAREPLAGDPRGAVRDRRRPDPRRVRPLALPRGRLLGRGGAPLGRRRDPGGDHRRRARARVRPGQRRGQRLDLGDRRSRSRPRWSICLLAAFKGKLWSAMAGHVLPRRSGSSRRSGWPGPDRPGRAASTRRGRRSSRSPSTGSSATTAAGGGSRT